MIDMTMGLLTIKNYPAEIACIMSKAGLMAGSEGFKIGSVKGRGLSGDAGSNSER
jgi:hypothetical protein